MICKEVQDVNVNYLVKVLGEKEAIKKMGIHICRICGQQKSWSEMIIAWENGLCFDCATKLKKEGKDVPIM